MSVEKIKTAQFRDIVYPSHETIHNTWAVSKWWKDDELITVTGILPEEPQKDTDYTLIGTWEDNEKYGEQFKLKAITCDAWDGVANIDQHLKALTTDLQYEAIHETYPDIDFIFNGKCDDPVKALCKVNGFGPKKSENLVAKMMESMAQGDALLQLKELGFTWFQIGMLLDQFGSYYIANKEIRLDPYLAVNLPGIGFRRADQLALRIGIDPMSPIRMGAFMTCMLRESAQNGRSWETKREIMCALFREFGGRENTVVECVNGSNNLQVGFKRLKDNGVLDEGVDPDTGEPIMFLTKYWNLEAEVANELKRLMMGRASHKISDDLMNQRLSSIEAKQGWQFTEDQRQGIRLALDNQVCLITGGAGTGKSTLVSGILAALDEHNFAQTALSGKAAARLQAVTGHEGMTIHRLLGTLDKKFKDAENEGITASPYLDNDLIILDEISLVGGEIFLKLLKAIRTGAKLIILGDMNQLEAIGTMNIAHDLYRSEAIPTVKLTKILRQAEDSGIISLADSVKRMTNIFGTRFEGCKTLGKLQDMHVRFMHDRTGMMDAFTEEFQKWYNDPLVGCNVHNIHVLAPTRDRGEICVARLNSVIQAMVNPKGLDRADTVLVEPSGAEPYRLAVGDKVMCIKNTYSIPVKLGLTWREIYTDVFNGWTGEIKKITPTDIHIYFHEGGMVVPFKISSLSYSIRLGYASTIHKFQGSSAPVIIGVTDNTTPPMLRSKELMYTLLTRAEKACVLLAQTETYNSMVHTSAISTKQTFLEGMLDENRFINCYNTELAGTCLAG